MRLVSNLVVTSYSYSVVAEPVRFPFFGSSVRRDDLSGQMLERWNPEELFELLGRHVGSWPYE